MKNALFAILLCGVAVVWYGGRADEAPALTDDSRWSLAGASVTRNGHAAEVRADARTGDKVQFRADTSTGEMRLQLPGGIEGKMRLPEGIGADTRFDLDGIGRYPGSRLLSIDVSGGGSQQGRVLLGFSAPGSADAVVDWYEKALNAKGRSVARTGNTLTGSTTDGEPMVIAVEDGPGDLARGRIIITDTD